MNTIYLFLDSRSMGGIESHVLNLAKSIKQSQLFVKVLFWQDYSNSDQPDSKHPLWQALQDQQIPVSHLNGSVRNLLKEVPPRSLLHSHGYKANIINKLFSVLGGWKALPTHHNGDLGSGLLRQYVRCDEFSSRWFNPISVSQEIHQRLKHRGLFIPNFIAEESKAGETKTEDRWQVAFVGRISDEKNPVGFCLISEYLHRELKAKKQQLHLYGDGEKKRQLEQRYPWVSFHGQKTMNQYWHKIDLLCITSISEGLPLAALEAMAQGIPVCSFAVGELPSLIEGGKNGWIIPNGNLELMAQKIRQWWQMPEQEKHKMRAAAIATIHNNYSDHAVVPIIIDHYKSLGCTNTAKMVERTKTPY